MNPQVLVSSQPNFKVHWPPHSCHLGKLEASYHEFSSPTTLSERLETVWMRRSCCKTLHGGENGWSGTDAIECWPDNGCDALVNYSECFVLWGGTWGIFVNLPSQIRTRVGSFNSFVSAFSTALVDSFSFPVGHHYTEWLPVDLVGKTTAPRSIIYRAILEQCGWCDLEALL